MPGAGGFRAANYMYNVAPKDGTAVGLVSQAVATADLMQTQGAQFEAAKFNWIWRFSSYVLVSFMWHTSKVKVVDDLRTIEATMGVTGPGSTLYVYPLILNTILGTKLKLVSGYEGANGTWLAMERGEVEGANAGWFTLKAMKKDWLAENKINVLVQYMAERHPDLPNVPTAVELGATEEDRQVLRLFSSEGDVGKAFMAPPGAPADRVAILRRAFDAMAKDPELIAEARASNLDFDPMPGEALQRLIQAQAEAPEAVLARARSILKK
jgi:tripartite-type tricarboxylate transporter receptor subunit TctC